MKKIGGCVNNPEISSTAKIGEHISCGCSMPTIWAFGNIENKRTLYLGGRLYEKFLYFFKRARKKYN